MKLNFLFGFVYLNDRRRKPYAVGVADFNFLIDIRFAFIRPAINAFDGFDSVNPRHANVHKCQLIRMTIEKGFPDALNSLQAR